ncbi:MAG: hypothetical protein JO338_03445 [Aquitalea sp.]|nr:hypothetical protein [Aquitalea sp.]
MKTLLRLAGLALLAGTTLASIPTAEARPGGYYGPPHFVHWNDGYWNHGYYRGRLGWWWVSGGVWYWYSAPVYPYPDPYVPPVVVSTPAVVAAPVAPPPPAEVASPAPAQVWYYCKAAKQYYPYVSECPGGWKTVPAQPPK